MGDVERVDEGRRRARKDEIGSLGEGRLCLIGVVSVLEMGTSKSWVGIGVEGGPLERWEVVRSMGSGASDASDGDEGMVPRAARTFCLMVLYSWGWMFVQ